ncbi:2-(3-amino-3-carboxypropyl)histidine synthase subunit 1 [Nosema granulosis]|uniref:2-(3-amino-3-carboxypropyl)histidine synthase subunit 1 n=1 Tax=Nosema granulosis TaxID=83296 RepID=A0A9P6KZ49_9MICR|nr:2-(3-amino-3-carboxypropyl)histidine synthase subunit 1 [Nosema granulosis]
MVLLKPKEFQHLPDTIKCLPQNYNFEINKTLRTILRYKAKKIALQFPDGLMKYSLAIIDTIGKYTGAECIILNDVVYGGCCIDDSSVEVDLLIHYGHSCLIPIGEMNTKVLYVFVDIKIDVEHLFNLIKHNFTIEHQIAILGTIQFNSSVNKLKRLIMNTTVPQIKPLSAGEVLGCTSPIIKDVQSVISIGDGRFHLESVMINNPTLDFYKYCPFSRKLTREYYDFERMKNTREEQIAKAFEGGTKKFGVILGTLGRQGSRTILRNVKEKLRDHKIYLLMLDEIEEEVLSRYHFLDAFVQISCPRLSVDWGHTFSKPILSPFEVFYEKEKMNYILDYYSKEGNSPWKNYNE